MGEQIELALGDQRAVVTEVGAGLRTYSVGGRELLDGYAADAMVTSGRGQVLLPWPNRIEDGAYEFDGRRHQLAHTEPTARNAIHGLVRWVAWSVSEQEPSRVVMTHAIHAQPGYPFLLAVELEYALTDDGLRVRTTATNAGAAPCPFGAGAHPYLTLGTPTVDPLVLSVPAGTVLVSDERGIPTGSGPVEGTERDFRSPRPIGETVLDHAFADLDRDDDGLARVRLRRAWERRRADALGRRGLPVPDGLHRRPAPGREPVRPRGRADDLPAERVPHGRGADPPRARRILRR